MSEGMAFAAIFYDGKSMTGLAIPPGRPASGVWGRTAALLLPPIVMSAVCV